jgi:hypothetical protein
MVGVSCAWKVFFDETSGANIQRDRYYGFCDSGGLAGKFEGYATRQECIDHCTRGWFGDISGQPEELGAVAVCALSGEEFVNRLMQVDELSEYGYIVE